MRRLRQLDLLEWISLSDNLWKLQWSPKWSIDIVVEATQYLSCTLEVRVSQFDIRGQLRQSFTSDLSSVTACFAKMPEVAFEVDCSTSWGVVPLPIEGAVERQIRAQMHEFLRDHWVHPRSTEIILADERAWAGFDAAAADRAKAAADGVSQQQDRTRSSRTAALRAELRREQDRI